MAFPKIEGYVVTEKLGSGSYSTVYKAITKVGARTVVAIKCVDKSQVKHSGTAVDNLITEIRLLKTLTHPHIVQMKEFTWDDRHIYIIMEFCCGGDLSRYITRYGRVPEKKVLYFLQQLASALKFLREKGVVHMDLKPHNLLLHKGSDGKYILKVADFGFAQYLSDESSASIRGSPLYMAPEMFEAKTHDARVDLWSVGVIMYECLFGRAPYSSSTFKELMEKIRKQTPIEIPPNSSISPGSRDLLTHLLQHSPDKRISYEDFFSHPYLDLEHMPSKENYDKAVVLIRSAVSLDAAGALAEALPAYCASLRYLLPAVAAEADPVRRSALTDKLTRYMERAEEIKQYLKTGEQPTRGARQPDGSRATNAAANKTPDTVEYNNIKTEQPQCIINVVSKCKCLNEGIGQCQCGNETVSTGPSGTENDDATPSATETQVKKEKSPRFDFKKLFRRQPSVPLLSYNDSSICNETESENNSKTATNADTNNDTCKIS